MKKILIIVASVVLVAAAALFFLLRPQPEKTYFYSTGDAFVVNALDSTKLIKTTITLGTCRDEEEMLTENHAVVRDCILNILRNQTAEQYQRGDFQQMISEVIVDRLNALFPPTKEDQPPLFVQAYFNDFVMD